MTTQFPDFCGQPQLPDHAVRSEEEQPLPAPAPASYTTGTPAGHTPAVQPEAVARQLMIPLPLDATAQGVLATAIENAQSDVEAYLGRPVVPLTYTDRGCIPSMNGWRLKHYPVWSIVSYTPETNCGRPTGRYTVVYVAGLDAVSDPDLYKIVRYIMLHAAYDPFVQILYRQLRPDIATRVTSGSTEGQSATITDALPTPSGSSRMSSPSAVTAQMSLPGSPPTLQTLDYWRIGKRRVYQRPRVLGSAAPWPYDLPDPGMADMWAGKWETWW